MNLALFTYFIPAAFLAIPMYKAMGMYGLLNNRWSLVLAMVTLAAPYAIFLAAVFAYPLGLAVWISFHDYFFAAPGAQVERPFVGLDNYRAMFDGAEKTWNLRDAHMTETLQSLQRHLGAAGRAAKIVVWAHNSHVGDARATEMSQRGEWNIGQLTRERYGEDSVRIGFTTYDGTVTAASNWDAPAERKRVRPALANSYEALFYEVDRPAFFLTLRDKAALANLMVKSE